MTYKSLQYAHKKKQKQHENQISFPFIESEEELCIRGCVVLFLLLFSTHQWLQIIIRFNRMIYHFKAF